MTSWKMSCTSPPPPVSRIVFHNRNDVGEKRLSGSHPARNKKKLSGSRKMAKRVRCLNRVSSALFSLSHAFWSRRQIPISIVMITTGKSIWTGVKCYALNDRADIWPGVRFSWCRRATNPNNQHLLAWSFERVSSNSNLFFFFSSAPIWNGLRTIVVVVVVVAWDIHPSSSSHLILHTKPYLLVLPFDSLSHHLLFPFWLLEKILFYQLAGRKRMKTIG